MVVWLVTFLVVGRQGDYLFHLFIFIVREVLSRKIINFILTKHITLKKFCFPSHILYADDIFWCLAGPTDCLYRLMKCSHSYSLTLWQ